MKLKINYYRMFPVLISLYTISCLLYQFIDPYFPLGNTLGFMIIIDFVFIFGQKNTKKDFYMVIATLIIALISLTLVNNYNKGFKDAIMWCTTILFVYKISDIKIVNRIYQELKSSKFIKTILIIDNILIIVTVLTNLGYTNQWGKTYYIGFSAGAHPMASTACLILCMTLPIIQEKKSIIFKMITLFPCILAILQSGARTYLISLMVIIFIFYIFNLEQLSIKYVLLPIAIILGVYLFMNTGMMAKFLNPNTYAKTTGLTLATSGRNEFWLIDLNAYKELNLLKKFIGNGFDYPYYVNQTQFQSDMAIWAHNDFINNLLTVGLVGEIIYIVSLIKSYKTIRYNTTKMIALSLFVYFFGVAFVNGLFGYQHYLYSYLMLFVGAVCMYKDKVAKNS